MKAATGTSGWRYCLFGFTAAKGGGWKAVNRLKYLSFGLPRSFIWKDIKDIDGLRTYVDLIAAGRKTEALHFQERGMVEDVEYDPEELTGAITVDAEDFFSTLALIGWVKLPLVERIRFNLNGRAITPTEYLTILAKYSGHPEWFDPEGARWATPQEVREIQPHSAMYTEERVGSFEAPVEEVDENAQPVESEVRRDGFLRHFELLTQVQPARGDRYFVRRLATFDGQLIWAGSSYQPNGPWTQYFRDNAQLIARNIQP